MDAQRQSPLALKRERRLPLVRPTARGVFALDAVAAFGEARGNASVTAALSSDIGAYTRTYSLFRRLARACLIEFAQSIGRAGCGADAGGNPMPIKLHPMPIKVLLTILLVVGW